MNFAKINFNHDPIDYIAPTWNEMSELAFVIAQQMAKQKITADRIVTLAKGGWPMTRSLVDFTGINEVASVGVKFYKPEIGQRFEQPEIYQDLPISIKGETVILFDDVADTGKSLEFTKQHLLKLGVKNVVVATLFYKPHSVLKPDFYGAETSAWIIFPYESRESFSFFNHKWTQEGLTETEIDERMVKLGSQRNWLAEYRKTS